MQTMSATLSSSFFLTDAIGALYTDLIIVFATMSALLLAVAAFVVAPMVVATHLSQASIESSFVLLPLIVRVMLHRAAAQRISALRTAIANEDESDDDEEGRGVAEAEGGVGSMDRVIAGFRAVAVGGEEEADGGGYDWERIVAAVDAHTGGGAKVDEKRGGSSPPPPSTSRSSWCCSSSKGAWALRRTARISPPAASVRSQGSHLWRAGAAGAPVSVRPLLTSLAVHLGPLFVLFAYYAALYAVSFEALDNVVSLQAVLIASGDRGACARELHMNLQQVVSTYASPAFVKWRRDALADGGDCVMVRSRGALLAPAPTARPPPAHPFPALPHTVGAIHAALWVARHRLAVARRVWRSYLAYRDGSEPAHSRRQRRHLGSTVQRRV